ncbi:uncharacterized protein F4812DRAFT_147163 [Daldinia caldariorum]|uniref:uncharacterized protein n=1 Tax=Daldinia caldariorum TaxID=326644 RepID=UPI0020074194|nr:uncharacterized protein F4812DRAFT_147163 [Daldinia caldariorum]KAI1464985.1 hypothetical protein F4812DRAFT_147163 [Daldinia caldariorum]
MARLAQAPITPKRTISNPDPLPDLNRLLDRLQANILRADAEREHRLRTSEYERAKARVNIDYARSLLTKLEHDALAIKVHTRRQDAQNDLNGKREVLEQIAERFREMEDGAADSDGDSSEGAEEDLLADIINTPSESVESASAAGRRGDDDDDDDSYVEDVGQQDDNAEVEREEEESFLSESRITDHRIQPSSAPQTHQATPTATAPGTSTSQTLRPRGSAPQQAPASSDTATATTTSALRTQLFGTRPEASATTTAATITSEAILDLHRAEQEHLTASMVSMARALKQSTHRFAASLREDEDVVRAAGANLARNERGLGAVAGRMGALRRVTEGKGWWGRVLLYAWIAGLAVFAVLLVFAFPKLRF